MMRKAQALLLFFTILLASCTEEPGSDYAWCYTYNFAASDYGVNIISGSWVDGEGLRADESGLLQVNWLHDQPVQPKRVTVTVVRPPGTVGEVAVNASAIAFGVSVELYGGTMYSDMDEISVNFLADYAGASGQSVNFTMDASLPLSIASIQFYGDFASPFPENQCTPPTLTATATDPFYPVDTATWTSTPLPSDTPEPPPEQFYWIGPFYRSFLKEQLSGGVSYPDGTDMANHPAAPAEYFGIYTRLFAVEAHTPYHTSGATSMAIDVRSLSSQTTVASMSINTDGGVLTMLVDSNIEHCSVRAARAFSGLPSPDEETVCDMVSLTGVRVKTGNSSQVNGGARPAMGFDWSGTASGVYSRVEVWYLYYGIPVPPTPTPSATASITPTRTPLFGGTPPFAVFPTRTPLQVGTSTPQNTPTDLPASSTAAPPPPTQSLVPLPTAVIPPTTDPGDTNPNPVNENDAEWEILGAIGDFFSWLQNIIFSLFDIIGQVGYWLSGTAANFVTLISNAVAGIVDFVIGVIGLLGQLLDIGRLLIQIIVRLIELLMSWIIDAVTRVGLILNGFFTAPALPIPGMPLCATDPIGSDVCAIYYILDYTLLAQGTPGQYIIPLVTIVINLFIILFFVRFVLRLIRRGESVTNVG